MEIQRGYKVELDPNNAQRTAFAQHAGAARWAYNWGLQRKMESYKIDRELNAAINLKNLALSSRVTACGEGVSLSSDVSHLTATSEKQEPNSKATLVSFGETETEQTNLWL